MPIAAREGCSQRTCTSTRATQSGYMRVHLLAIVRRTALSVWLRPFPRRVDRCGRRQRTAGAQVTARQPTATQPPASWKHGVAVRGAA